MLFFAPLCGKVQSRRFVSGLCQSDSGIIPAFVMFDFNGNLRDKWAERPYQKLSTAGRAVTAGLPGLDKRKSWLISNSGKAARRYRATGGVVVVVGGGSRSDKKDGRVSSGGRVHSGWRPGLCCPPSVVLLVLCVQVGDEGGRIRMREILRAGRCERTVDFTASLCEVAHRSSVISRELSETAAQQGICGSSGGNCASFGVN